MDKKLGQYSFIGGMLLAVVVGVLTPLQVIDQQITQWLVSLLVVLGILAGWSNVSAKQQKDFMMVTAMLIVAAGIGGAANIFGGVMYIGEYIRSIFQGILAVIIPAAVVVLLKEVWAMGTAKKK